MAAPVSRTNRCRRRGTCAWPQTLGSLRIEQAVALRRTRRGTCALQSGSCSLPKLQDVAALFELALEPLVRPGPSAGEVLAGHGLAVDRAPRGVVRARGR